MKYSFNLKDSKEKSYKLFNWFLFFMHFVAASVFALNATERNVKISLYVLLGFYAVITAIFLFFRKNKKAFETYSLIMALLYGNFWLKHVGVVALLIFAAIFLFVTIVQGKKTAVVFSEKGVELVRIFKSILFPWKEMANVILKDNILTIDFKSNKIIQVEISENDTTVDVEGFNGFCETQLQSELNSVVG